MANQQHLIMLRQGVNIWNQWRKNNRGIIPVLSEVNLSKENLCGADLNWANLRDANLSGANLSRANLRDANLSGANLSGADLSGADLSEAKLEYAKLRYAQISHETLIEEKWRLVWEIINHGAARKDLSGANLSEVDLSGVNLSEVDLSGANLSKANLSDANLSGANLSGVNLFGADITRADIYEVNFSKANITGLIGASFNIKEFYEVYKHRQSKTAAAPVRDKRNFSEILLSLESQVSNKRLLSSKQNPLPGILLYTEQDELSDYIKNHFEYIDTLTGNCFIIYLLEKPPLRWRNSNLYWKEILELYLYKIIPIFHWCRRIKNKPYNKSEVYDIARQWKVDINKLPCLVLFNPKNLSEKIIFDINKSLPQNKFEYYFRDLFSELDKRLIFHESQENGELRLNCTTTFKKIQSEFLSIIKFLEEKYSKKEKRVERRRQSQIIYDLREAQFGGSLVDAETVNTHQIGGNITNYNQEQKQNLAQAAAEIQQLLQQLEQTNPTTTTSEKMTVVAKAIDEIEKNPTLKARVIGALKSGGKEALKEAVDHPLVNILMASIEGWQEAE
jgi:uncharacterized protein YjbI with pentapeptide repeats